MGRPKLKPSQRRRNFGGTIDPDLYAKLEARAEAEAEVEGGAPSVSRVIEKAVKHYLATKPLPKAK
jgi:hypothetical protein